MQKPDWLVFTQVTTKRAEGNWNADTPCYNSEVDKLEGCGREMSKNLQDVRACAREKGHGFVPPEGINYVKTGTAPPPPHPGVYPCPSLGKGFGENRTFCTLSAKPCLVLPETCNSA